MADIAKTIDQINGGLIAANTAVGLAATFVTSIVRIIARRRDAGEDVADFEAELTRYASALSRVEQLDTDYWSQPEKPKA